MTTIYISPAYLVVVAVLREPLLLLEDRQAAAHQAVEEGLALLLGRKERAAERGEEHE